MAEYLGNLFGEKQQSAADDDFVDFATPSLASPVPVPTGTAASAPSIAATPAPGFDGPWYAVWERTSPSDFKFEGYVAILLFFVIGAHLWGTKRNRQIAKKFISDVTPVLTQEFAYVGFDRLGRANTINTTPAGELGAKVDFNPETALKENHPLEFISYASGRQNISFMHTTIKLQRRSNPVAWFGEQAISFFLDSLPPPGDSAVITISPFDGLDAGKLPGNQSSSKYDNFVWALVNKKDMKRWRDERYDLSLTTTKDWEGLPSWLAVMTESNEVGNIVLTQELKDAVVNCQDILEYIIVTDQPIDKPLTLEETTPKKRVSLKINLPTDEKSAAAIPVLLSAFIRLVDHLADKAHFNPNVTKKIRAVRDVEIKKLQKVQDEEKAEERMLARDEAKKAERDRKLRGMTADEQKKYLEKEREKEGRKAMKKQQRK